MMMMNGRCLLLVCCFLGFFTPNVAEGTERRKSRIRGGIQVQEEQEEAGRFVDENEDYEDFRGLRQCARMDFSARCRQEGRICGDCRCTRKAWLCGLSPAELIDYSPPPYVESSLCARTDTTHGAPCRGRHEGVYCNNRTCRCTDNQWVCGTEDDIQAAIDAAVDPRPFLEQWCDGVDFERDACKTRHEGRVCGNCRCTNNAWQCTPGNLYLGPPVTAPPETTTTTEAGPVILGPPIAAETTTTATTNNDNREGETTTTTTPAPGGGGGFAEPLYCRSVPNFAQWGECAIDRQSCNLATGACLTWNERAGECQTGTEYRANCLCESGSWICDPIPLCAPCLCEHQWNVAAGEFCWHNSQVCPAENGANCTCSNGVWQCEEPVIRLPPIVVATLPVARTEGPPEDEEEEVITTQASASTLSTGAEEELEETTEPENGGGVVVVVGTGPTIGNTGDVACRDVPGFQGAASSSACNESGAACWLQRGNCQTYDEATQSCQDNPWTTYCTCDEDVRGEWFCGPIYACPVCRCEDQYVADQAFCANTHQACPVTEEPTFGTEGPLDCVCDGEVWQCE